MRKNVPEPEKVAAAHHSMTGGGLGDLSTPMQPMQEMSSEEMSILQDALQVWGHEKPRRPLMMAAAAVTGGAVTTAMTSVMTSAFVSATLALVALVAVVILHQYFPLKPKLLSPPGSWARAALSFGFSKKTFDNVYAQAIADMRDEHFEALAEGRLWKARWIALAYYINLFLTVSAWFGTSVLQKVVGLWKIGL